jgi:hypothetical protein
VPALWVIHRARLTIGLGHRIWGRLVIVRWLALEVMLSPEVVIARIARTLGV